MRIIFSRKILIVAMLALCMGYPALADHAPPQTLEIQGLNTITSTEVTGLASESDEMAWQLSNRELNNPPLSMPFMTTALGSDVFVINIPGLTTGGTGETQYTISYSENTVASQGSTSYIKENSLGTGNKASNQMNFNSNKIVSFDGADAGRMTSSENLLVDGAAQYDRSTGMLLCPFATTSVSVIPPYCNIAEMGSSVDISNGLLHTTSGERTVAATADVPVTATYSVGLSGIGQSPASGTASAYMQTHLQEGAMQFLHRLNMAGGAYIDQFREGKSSDLTYSERTTVTGEITSFQKDIIYESGIRRID
ncbi:hypothetical protein EHM76_03970 [bacterium]|nr:MAG: hypothetical protein EHM76_03970 [bacterium]